MISGQSILLAATESAGIAGAQSAPAGSLVEWAWLIPVVPAVSAALLLIFGKRLGAVSALVAIAAAAVSFAGAVGIFAFLQGEPAEGRVFVHELGTWIHAGPLEVDWALLVDPLSSIMMLLVTGVGLLIHIYSVGYMHGDERYPRFFAYLNLFLASMLILVLGESFLVLFVGWELVGLCSYLLIGFWFAKPEYASAAKKAFVVNRIGDVGFLIAMFIIFGAFGSLSFAEVLPQAGTLAGGTAVAIGLLLFLGATGKSAQIPLYVWLPDAMAGPTPVSALIHAATMVTAGVYLIARTSPIYTTIPDVGMAVAWVGVLTALLAALIACVQVDIKKILAYSTVSQLGYMFVGVGVGDYGAGVFHLLTHGFFKALLFLAAGAVMHALLDETDVWKMGGLARKMPITAITSGIAVLAISGFPFTSGFYSKEEVLAAAADTPGGQAIWVIGLLVAGLTAFYMGRWFMLIFLGKPRWETALPDAHPHEAPATMWIPLVLLAVASAAGGLINIDPKEGFLHGWLEPSVVAFEARAEFLPHSTLLVLAVGVGLLGLLLAWNRYLRQGYEPGLAPVRYPRAHAYAFNRFYVDEAYQATIARPGRMLADGFAAFDRSGVDGAVTGTARLMTGLAGVGRRLQTGYVRSYALAVLVGTVLVVGVLVGTAVFGRIL
jgi:NADH-quinone oxidoreductase subunit L